MHTVQECIIAVEPVEFLGIRYSRLVVLALNLPTYNIIIMVLIAPLHSVMVYIDSTIQNVLKSL